MLSAVIKDALTKEIDVKEFLTKEIDIKEFLEMEIELTKLKKVLATEVKLKEFLIQEIDLSSLLSSNTTVSTDSDRVLDEESAELNINDRRAKGRRKTDKVNPTKDLTAYDYGLIQLLSEEHKEIRFIFNRVMSYAVEKKYENATIQLDIFNKEIRDHYKKADIELYAYLKTYVQIKYPKREKAFTQLSLEMKNLSIEIFYIISQSPNLPLSDKTHDGFIKEFITLGKLLNERIHREENLLFKMYEQTNKAKSIS